MRRELAERLLAHIMEWSDSENAEERAYLEDFAAYKYDEYQQFSPGRRFLESLALWLRQFEPGEERRAAYQFVRERLVFISEVEMTRLVELAFPDFVRPHLIAAAAAATGIEGYRVKKIIATTEYRIALRRTLFLGLSDGARTDRFRRANPQEISNEQIWHAYDVSDAKALDMRDKLQQDLKTLGIGDDEREARFETVVLLDDFTASGKTYLKEKGGELSGKIAKIVEQLDSDEALGSLIGEDNITVIVIIYVAAAQAVEHITPLFRKLKFSRGEIEFKIVHELSGDVKISEELDKAFYELIEKEEYFDTAADDEHGAVGGDTVRYGFSNCRLPVVLAHNTPNNSVFLLWAEDILNIHGLFPRVSRHRTFE